MNSLNLVQQIMVWILPILFAVTVHEVAHGWVASQLGDKTALLLGRLTLNPFRHIDMVGTVIVPLLCLLFGGFIFGWAKPVPVDWRNLRKPRRDTILVSIAGPASNFLMAFIWAIIAKIGEIAFHQGFQPALFLGYVGEAGIAINLLLMILNMIPIPPLDGSRVVSNLLPRRLANAYDAIEPYGLIILVVLIFSNVLSLILMSPMEWMQRFIFGIFAL